MKNIQFNIPPEAYVPTYLNLMNGIFRMTELEVDVLAAFIEFDPDSIATSEARKHVVRKLGFKNVAVLNNYVKKLKNKSAIVPAGSSRYTLHPSLHPRNYKKGIQFSFNYAKT